MSKKLTTEEFIKRAKQTHGDKYDYSLVQYIDQRTKVKIICSVHGEFEQYPDNHYKYGCLECGGRMKLTQEDFIKRANHIHNNRYNYSLVEYINCDLKVKIVCSEHGMFEQTPSAHIHRDESGCPKCNKPEKITIDNFIKKSKEIHNNKYDYSLVEFDNIDTDVKIICPIHGIYIQNARSHYKNSGCPRCHIESTRTKLVDFIEKSNIIHHNKYDYSLTEYINCRTKIKIICPIHGIFIQSPGHHLGNRGCPHCRMSKGERTIKKILDDNNLLYIYEQRFQDCRDIKELPFDFFLPEYNTCIEYDGEQHFISIDKWGGLEQLKNIKFKDNIKNEYCLDKNINLIRIKYSENIDDVLNKKLLKKENGV